MVFHVCIVDNHDHQNGTTQRGEKACTGSLSSKVQCSIPMTAPAGSLAGQTSHSAESEKSSGNETNQLAATKTPCFTDG